MGLVQCLRILARALDWAKDPDPDHWKTINGSHVYRQAAAGRWAIKLPEALGKPPQAPRSVGDSDWAEDKHPRDEGGRFTSGGGAARPRKYKKKVVKLPVQEYALVMHDLNTNLPFNQRKNTIVYKAIGNYVYTVKVSGFNDYTIIDKADLN